MTKDLAMTVLADNIGEGELEGEWGLSILIEAGDQTILLDTGAGETFARNARKMGIDLRKVDVGVLSHAHYDHSDGMDTFFEINRKAPFLVREGCAEDCYGKKEGGEYKYIGIKPGILGPCADRIRYVSGVYEIAGGIWLLPHRKKDYSRIALRNDLYRKGEGGCCPDDFTHEQSLVIETPQGLVVFNSCSHAGPDNILEDVRQMLGRSDVYAYVGGLHLFLYTDEELHSLCGMLERMNIRQIYTGHCTGDHAYQVLRDALKDKVTQFRSGFRCTLSSN